MSDFTFDYEGVGELLCGPEMQALMHKGAELISIRARSDAPVDPSSPHPGRYRESFVVEFGVREAKTKRAFGRVVNTADEAILVEYGSRNNPRHRTLGRSLDFLRTYPWLG